MGGASGPVQLAELGVSLNDTLIDSGGQAEGRVDLQEVDAGQRRAANSSHMGRCQEKSRWRAEDPAERKLWCVFLPAASQRDPVLGSVVRWQAVILDRPSATAALSPDTVKVHPLVFNLMRQNREKNK